MLKIYDQSDKNIPLFILIMLSLFVPLQLLMFWTGSTFPFIPLNNEIIISSSLTIICSNIMVMLITTAVILIKPQLCVKISRLFLIVFFVCSVVMCLYTKGKYSFHILSLVYSVLNVSVIATYIYTFHYQNIFYMFTISTIMIGILNGILYNGIFNVPIFVYKLIILIIFFLLTISFYMIKSDIKIKNRSIKRNKSLKLIFTGTFVIICLATIFACFSIMFASYIKLGLMVLHCTTIIAGSLFLILTKKFKIDTFYLINIYVGLSFIGFVLTLIPSLHILACFFLSFGLVVSNLTCFLGNTLFYSYRLKSITLVIILINIITTVSTLVIFFVFQNNIQSITVILFILITVLFIILFIFMPSISNEYRKNVLEKNDKTLFEKLSKRENEIVNYLLNGYTSGQLSKELYISLPTIKTHLSNIYRKLEINSKQELFQLINKNKNT